MSRDAGEDTGSYNIGQGTLALNSNYNLTFYDSTLSITARSIAVTADDMSKGYGLLEPDLTYKYVGTLVGDDQFSGALVREMGEDAGTYSIDRGSLTLGSNYSITYNPGTMTITARPITVNADDQSKVYGDEDPILSYTVVSGSLVFSDAFSGALTRDAGEDAGKYDIVQGTLALNNNYVLSFNGGELTVNQRPMTISVVSVNKDFGTKDPAAYDLSFSGFADGEGVEQVSGIVIQRDPGELVGTYAIRLSGATAGNYDITMEDGELVILPVAGYPVPRIFGNNRYQTAVQVSQRGWETSDSVVLARGDSFPDSLSGIPLAYALDAPILLTHSNTLPVETRTEIIRLQADKVIILGGTGAISANVEAQLKAMGLEVERIGGSNRYETAILVAERMGGFNTAFLVSGTDFPDALAAASYAARQGAPILLTGNSALAQTTANYLQGKGLDRVIIVGGLSSVSQGAEDSLKATVPEIIRIAGGNRYETSAALADRYLELQVDHVYISSGQHFTDALVGAVLAAKQNTGVLLVDGSQTQPNTAVWNLIQTRNVQAVTVLGGSVPVREDLAQWLRGPLSRK